MQNLHLTTSGIFSYSLFAVAKSTASRRKLKFKKANSTPKACFFVRSTRTPKARLKKAFSPMVGRKGQPLAVGCLPFWTVFLPLYALPPAVGKLAVSLTKLKKDTVKMIYRFLTLGKNRLKISIPANSLEEALSRVKFEQRPLLIARLHKDFYAKKSPIQTAIQTTKGGIYA